MQDEGSSVLRVLIADDDKASASANAVARLLGAQFARWLVDIVALPMEALGQILDNAYDAVLWTGALATTRVVSRYADLRATRDRLSPS